MEVSSPILMGFRYTAKQLRIKDTQVCFFTRAFQLVFERGEEGGANQPIERNLVKLATTIN